MIRSAILLAAGRGKRLRPYTDTLPKPLLPIRGRPTLDFVLTAAQRAGIERVCIVTHHLEGKIFAYIGDGARWNLQITFTHQSELRGNGDALLSVPRAWIGDESFLVAATDYILEEHSLHELVAAHHLHQAAITISLKECDVEELSARSNVQVDLEWQVKRIIEKPSQNEIISPYAASAMFVLPPAIWDYLPRVAVSSRGEIELQSAVQMMIEDGFKTFGLLQPAPLEWSPELA